MTTRVIAGTPGRQRRAVIVTVAGRRLALHAEAVAEVAEIASFTPLACEDPAHLGVALYRDRIVPVVDLVRRVFPELTGSTVAEGAVCVIGRTVKGEVAFPVDSVVGLGAGDGTDDDVAMVDLNRLPGAHGEDRPR